MPEAYIKNPGELDVLNEGEKGKVEPVRQYGSLRLKSRGPPPSTVARSL